MRTIFIAFLAVGCGDGLNLAPTGESCELGKDCEGGVCLQDFAEMTWPEGYCTSDCTEDGTESCPEGMSCLYNTRKEEKEGRCFVPCVSKKDCREGYGCYLINFWKSFCLPTPESQE